MAKVYVASSWRNDRQPIIVNELLVAGHEVYDFRNPAPGNHGFHWSDIDPDWRGWNPTAFREGLEHPVAKGGFELDFDAMAWADVCVLLMPCGRSAHIEAGWFVGHPDKRLFILLSDGEPELMYRMADVICVDLPEILAALSETG